MTGIDISFSSPLENILLDEALLQMGQDKGNEYLRFWESSAYFVVLGRISSIEDDVDITRAKASGISVLRRASGGGTVLQGPGCLNYSFVLSKEKSIQLSDLRKSYGFILTPIVQALEGVGVPCQFMPISDLAVTDGLKKFSGNAQRRVKNFILHHGTILYNFDLNKIEDVLKIPADRPEYRHERSHRDFLTNIPLEQQVIKQAVSSRLGVREFRTSLTEDEKKYFNVCKSKKRGTIEID